MEAISPLVSAEWLAANLKAPDIRLVDATWRPSWQTAEDTPKALYNQAHLPGAVYFDIDEIADDERDLPHMLPSPIKFSARVRRLGIGDGHRIVLYDSNNLFASARAWWMFRAMGHNDVFVLNGGLAAWERAGGEMEDMPPAPAERHFTPRVRGDLLKDADQVNAALRDGAPIVLDARPADRFEGSAPEPRAEIPSGHMPGSRNLPADALLDDAGTLKDTETLRAAFEDAGAPLNIPIVATCGSGVSASILLLARAALGDWSSALYDGSWTEWAGRDDAKIATGRAV